MIPFLLEGKKSVFKILYRPGSGGTCLQSQHFCEFKASMVCSVSSRTARSTQTNPALENKDFMIATPPLFPSPFQASLKAKLQTRASSQ